MSTYNWANPFIGEKLGTHTVTAVTRTKRGTMVKLLCLCGEVSWKEYVATRSRVRLGGNVGCKMCRARGMEKSNLRGRAILAQWKTRMPWLTITMCEYIGTQNCFYCGGVPSNRFIVVRKALETRALTYQGVDEVEYGRGHTIGNILPACILCNKAKSNRSLMDFCLWWNRRRTKRYRFTPASLIQAAREFGNQLNTACALAEASSSEISK